MQWFVYLHETVCVHAFTSGNIPVLNAYLPLWVTHKNEEEKIAATTTKMNRATTKKRGSVVP